MGQNGMFFSKIKARTKGFISDYDVVLVKV